jgi:hypothetical protein
LIDTTGEPDMENQFTKGKQFTKQDRRFLVEMSAELSSKIDTSTQEGADFEAAIERLMDAADAYALVPKLE